MTEDDAVPPEPAIPPAPPAPGPASITELAPPAGTWASPAWPPPVAPSPAGPAWEPGSWRMVPLPRVVALAPGRRLLVASATLAGGAAILLAATAAADLGDLAALPPRYAGTAATVAAADGEATLRAITVLAALAALIAGLRWLRRVARALGTPGLGALLAAVAEVGGGPRGGLAAARRTALLVAVLALAGALLVAVGGVLWVGADDGRVARAGGMAGWLGAIAVAMAAALTPSLLRAVERREVEASRIRDGGPVYLPGRRSTLGNALLAGAIVGLFAVSPLVGAGDVTGCRLDATWACRRVDVPVDHADGAVRPATLSVGYAVHAATGRPAGHADGTLVIAVGGPGASGIADGPLYLELLDDRVIRSFDIVMFDARGVGRTDPHDCPAAASAYSPDTGPEADARRFVEACIAEAGVDPATLSRYATAQVVEDIDAIREQLGVERIAVYGSSYGTVVAQAYGAAHPDRVTGIVLDAPIDRTLPGARLWATSARGFEAALAGLLDGCSADPACRADLPDPRRSYDRVVRRLSDGEEIKRLVAGPNGDSVPLSLDLESFESMTGSVLYDTAARMLLLRALAASERGDDRPLLHLADVMFSNGPGESSSFGYYATWCGDTRASPTDRTDDYAAYMRVAAEAGIVRRSSLAVFDSIVPCLWWPAQPPPGPPPPDPVGAPMLILTATGDPVTPSSEAHAILDRVPSARLVETAGGAHGTLGTECPTAAVTAFLLEGRSPERRVTSCPGAPLDPFLPLAPARTDDPWEAAVDVLLEVVYSPDLLAWDGAGAIQVGCLDGGTATVRGDRGLEGPLAIELDGCRWIGALPVDGHGTFDGATGSADITVSSRRGELHVTRSGDGPFRVAGTWDGEAVDVAR